MADSLDITPMPADPGPSPGDARQSLSRRRLLGRLATSAAAGAVLTPAALAAGSSDDAELLALGKQCDALYAEHEDLEAKLEPRMREYRYRMEARYHDTGYAERVQLELGIKEELDRQEAISEVLQAPVHQISGLPAHTLAGLAVKARSAAFYWSQLWNGPIDDDDAPEDHAVRALVAAVLAMAGEPLPFDAAARAAQTDDIAVDKRDVDFRPLPGFLEPDADKKLDAVLEEICAAARVSFKLCRQSKAEAIRSWEALQQ
jgi:hypothetical protein